jgi:hypothetical protein
MLRDRGPRTPADRRRALKRIRRLEADPPKPNPIDEAQWPVKGTIEVPDIRLDICSSLYEILIAPANGGQIRFDAMMCRDLVRAGESDRGDDGPRHVEAGVEGLLRAYALLLKSNANDREPYLDKLMDRRDEGMTENFLKSLMAS